MLAALNSRAQTEQTTSIGSLLTLFLDEYGKASSGATPQQGSIEIIRNVDVRRDSGHEMAIMMTSSTLLCKMSICSTDFMFEKQRIEEYDGVGMKPKGAGIV